MAIRLIATDLDGTTVRSDHRTISPRTRAAFAAARDAGIAVVAISGRQPYSIGALVAGTALEGPIIGSNGAVGVDLRDRSLLFEEMIEVDAQRALAERLVDAFPGVRIVSVRDGGNTYVGQYGYVGQRDPGAEHTLWAVDYLEASLDEVLAAPSLKLVISDPEVTPDQLLEVSRSWGIPGVHPTISGAPFLEVAREGVSKASALARLAHGLGIDPGEAVAFGDNTNDVEMLEWAGLGVAMGNATGPALAAADEVTLDNDADGVAVVIERLLG
ncbi:MAG: HAD-IIB family hydrolase [Propioniciclava sp.]|uniref:HAD-IIB family hydrolase n=1 Tax=Propioniciclava sp. TaxID=2038686 RepID=UPI0039E6F180